MKTVSVTLTQPHATRNSTHMSTRILALAVALGELAVTASAQTTFDAVAEFSMNDNPTGVWSYGSTSKFGRFNLSTNKLSYYVLPGWGLSTAHPTWYPVICKNNTGELFVYDNFVVTDGQVIITPGDTAEARYGVVRFTAPTTGLYDVRASFVGACSGGTGRGTTSDAHVVVNGTSLFDATISGYGNGVSFTSAFPLTLNAGDAVDFVVGDGGNGIHADNTGFSATVSLLAAGSRVLLYPAVELAFATDANKTYQIQWAEQAQTNNWYDLGSPVTGDGAMHYMFDSTRGRLQRFYRVLTQ